jgi:hypothetical protein
LTIAGRQAEKWGDDYDGLRAYPMTDQEILAHKTVIRSLLESNRAESQFLLDITDTVDLSLVVVDWTDHASELLLDIHRNCSQASDHLGQAAKFVRDLKKEIFITCP